MIEEESMGGESNYNNNNINNINNDNDNINDINNINDNKYGLSYNMMKKLTKLQDEDDQVRKVRKYSTCVSTVRVERYHFFIVISSICVMR